MHEKGRSALFCLHPWDVKKKQAKKIATNELGAHLFLRHRKDAIQARLAECMDFSTIPHVFLYGNPHIDNYARTNTGCGMIDFDSAMYGPYIIDVFSLFMSVNLRYQMNSEEFDNTCAEAFLDEYLRAVSHPTDSFLSYSPLLKEEPETWQLSAEAYLEHNKKWAKKCRKNPLPTDDPMILELLRQYYLHRGEAGREQDYTIEMAGQGVGSMGRIHYLFVLKGRDQQLQILDIKHTKNYLNLTWPHHRFYHHDFSHEGQRMIAASELHAPGITHQESYATLHGIQYWGCELPTINMKINGMLNHEQAVDFCRAMGSQMGRSHCLSLQNVTPVALQKDIQQRLPSLMQHGQHIRAELLAGWQHFRDIYEKNT